MIANTYYLFLLLLQSDELALSTAILDCQTRVHESLLDNINTAAALDALAGAVD